MYEDIHACIDRVLPEVLRVAAAAHAVAESPLNEPEVRLPAGSGVTRAELAGLVGKLWSQRGRSLRVRFLDGEPSVHSRVEQFVHQWSRYANITFEFGADPAAEIRISFRQRGSWSYIGTDALSIARGEPTMNFGWLTTASTDEEYERVVVHEFGHALGCIHEHQHPNATIPWNREAVYRYYGGPPNNWTREQVDVNLFQRYSRDITQFSAFDPQSIMLYPVPKELTDGVFEIGWNRRLSPTDQSFIGTLYPGGGTSATELTLDAQPVQAAIGKHGEVDVFRFVVPAAGEYVVETEGPTDVVMTLLGPNDPDRVIGEDDDSGERWNARIARDLAPGAYHVRVRHYRPRGTGQYRVSARTGVRETIRACFDRFLPPDQRVAAAEQALAERPANEPELRLPASANPARAELAALVGKLWQKGRTLRVRFLDGDPAVQAKVQTHARTWSQYANITFEFGADPAAEIRISFRQRGSWSYIGTDALSITTSQPTMNFGWLTPASTDEEYERVVVHEFGHALGCIHEHQSPAAGIPWDKPAVYRYYGGPPNNWTREQVDVNLFQRYSGTITRFSAFDPNSIMEYPIANELTIGDYEVGWNRSLSATDKAFIGTLYPFDATTPRPTRLVVDAPPAQASIGKDGEIDLFEFVVATEGSYTVETHGPTDLVLRLLGPDNATALVAEDDDSGQSFNARVTAALKSGTYTVQIRHYSPRGMGAYAVSVRHGS